MPSSVISLYCTYLCYSALASEPRDYECNGLHKHSKAVSTGTLTLGLLTTTLSVVYSAVRAGSSATVLSPPSSPRAGKFFNTIMKSKNTFVCREAWLNFGTVKDNNEFSLLFAKHQNTKVQD